MREQYRVANSCGNVGRYITNGLLILYCNPWENSIIYISRLPSQSVENPEWKHSGMGTQDLIKIISEGEPRAPARVLPQTGPLSKFAKCGVYCISGTPKCCYVPSVIKALSSFTKYLCKERSDYWTETLTSNNFLFLAINRALG